MRRGGAMAVVRLDLFLFASTVICLVLATAIHEIGGHLFVAWLVGAHPAGFQLASTSGFAHIDQWPSNATPLAYAAVAGAGIVVQLIFGAAALVMATRTRRVVLRMVLVLFGAVSVLGPLSYMSFGWCYGVGDPGEFADLTGLAGPLSMRDGNVWIWVYPTFAMGVVAMVVARIYLRAQDALLPARRGWRRIVQTGATVGVVMVLFGVMDLATARFRPGPVAEMLQEAATARRTAAESRRILGVAKATVKSLGGCDKADIQSAVEARVNIVRAEPLTAADIHVDPPVHALQGAFVIGGGLMALFTTRRRGRRSSAGPGWRVVGALSVLALAVTLALL